MGSDTLFRTEPMLDHFAMHSSTSGDEAPGPARSDSLKRGDACLACRRRRIRCTAEKPACSTCVRLHKECIYDSGKGPSRISKLKDKIAELENVIASGQVGNIQPDRRPSDTPSIDDNIPQINSQSNIFGGMDFQNQPMNPFASNGMFNHDTQNLNHNHQQPAPAPIPTIDPTPICQPSSYQSIPQSLPDPVPTPSNFFNMGSQSTNPRPLQQPDQNFSYDFGLLDTTMMDLTSTFDMQSSFNQAASNTPSVDTPFTEMLNNQIMTIGYQQSQDIPHANYNGNHHTPSNYTNGVIGGWFDPHDVPPGVRDHLLDLHFSRQGVFSALFHIPRFYARLTLPLAKRPHPALLYMMYVSATKVTTQPALKQLQSKFFEIAQQQIHQGMKDGDRLLDVLRAMVLITGYTFSKEWYNLGYNMAGSAIRLAVACGLHKIPSAVWRQPFKYNAALHFTLRTGGYALDPPADAVELGERILAFWAVYELDQCTSITFLWDPGFRLEEILTPLPRPIQEFETHLISTMDDVTLAESVTVEALIKVPANHNEFQLVRMKALALISKAIKLRDLPPEPTRSSSSPREIDPHDPMSPGRFGISAKSLRDYTPRAFKEVKDSLDMYCKTLYGPYRTPWEKWDEGRYEDGLPRSRIRKDTATLWFLIAAAYIHLWNIRSLASENKQALLVARRTAALIGIYSGEEMLGGYSAFMICIWNEIAMILLRETKRLQILNRFEEARPIEADLNVVMRAIDDWAAESAFSTHDSVDIAAINHKMLTQLRAMSRTQWIEAMKEGERRFA